MVMNAGSWRFIAKASHGWYNYGELIDVFMMQLCSLWRLILICMVWHWFTVYFLALEIGNGDLETMSLIFNVFIVSYVNMLDCRHYSLMSAVDNVGWLGSSVKLWVGSRWLISSQLLLVNTPKCSIVVYVTMVNSGSNDCENGLFLFYHVWYVLNDGNLLRIRTETVF